MKNEDIDIGIVVIGYKNALGIKRLLDSLEKAYYNKKNIKLIISIDYSGDDTVEKIANDFEWKYGEKIIKAYKSNLGLREHILKSPEII